MARIADDDVLIGLIKKQGGGGQGGTSNYEDLENKPKIAGTTLSGNKSLADLGIASVTDLANKVDKVDGKGLSTNDFTDAYKTAIGDNTTAINAIKDGQSIDSFADVETALSGKQATLTFDDTPTDNSNNPVKSNGIYDALALKQNATDNSLDTTAKTIVGAINEHEGDIVSLKSGLTTLDNEVNGDAVTYPYADVITIEDAVPSNLADCSVKIEPVQDLHGQSAPYVGGAGKNKLPMTVDSIKALNTTGTWSGNVYTVTEGTVEILADNANNVVGIKVNITAGADRFVFALASLTNYSGYSYILNGCPSGGGSNAFEIQWWINNVGTYQDFGDGVTVPLIAENKSNSVSIIVRSGYTANNLIFYPMIRLATETDATFAPYTNICPITGHTEASVQRDGKNWFVGNYEKSYIEGDTNVYKYSANCRTAIVSIIGGYQYTISKNSGSRFSICESEQLPEANTSYNLLFNDKTKNTATVTASATSKYLLVYVDNDNTEPQLQVELGSIATPYEPYQGKTYTIALGDTIYGGTVDFDSGVMTVTKKNIDLGALSWAENGTSTSGKYRMYAAISTDLAELIGVEIIPDAECEIYGAISLGATYSCLTGIGVSDNQILVYDERYNTSSSASSFKTAMDGVHLCYKLATPTTIQLTPQQIQLLKGTNTLTASTGQISVTVNGVSGSIGALTEDVAELSDNFDEVIGWSDRRNLFDAKHVAIEELPNATGTLQYGCKFDVVAGKKYTVSSNMTESLYLFSKTGTDAAANIFTLASTKSFSFTAATNTIYYLRNASSITVDTFRNKLLNGEVQLEEGSVATNYQTFHPIIGDAVNGLIDRVPTAPTTDGTYNLQVTVSSGTPTYSWVSTT